jgi:hypothetical protein
MLGALLLWFMRAMSLFRYLPRQLRVCFQSRLAATLPYPSFDRPPLALRI